MKLSFPHKRMMRQNYNGLLISYLSSLFNCSCFARTDDGGIILVRGEQVDVVGASPQRGYMLVEHHGVSIHVPSQLMELRVSEQLASTC